MQNMNFGRVGRAEKPTKTDQKTKRKREKEEENKAKKPDQTRFETEPTNPQL